MKKLKPISRLIIAAAALLMISAFYVPIWQILMWAPQYPEGLEMKIWIDNITGDVRIISALNHYIGMRHIEVSMFPEFTYMKYIVSVLIILGLVTAIINKRVFLVTYLFIVLGCGAAALIDFYIWGYDYGHNLDPKAPIIVPGMSYQPPVIGTKVLLNFTAFSGPDTGGWIFLVSGLLLIGTLALEIYLSRKIKATPTAAVVAALLLIMLTSCSSKPEPLSYNKDMCYSCKMTLVDQKFGAEIVTKKGKVYKFDDINCMIKFLNTGEVKQPDIAYSLVVDFSSPAKLIETKNAFFVKASTIKSPMASNVAAFENKETLERYNQSLNGEVASWEQLETELR